MIRKGQVRFGGGTVEKYHLSMLKHVRWQLATFLPTLSKETKKGKLESSLQGYHNGHVPWGYASELKGKRRIGVPDPEKAPVVQKMFELFATGVYSDAQIADWLNEQGYKTWRGRIFSKDTIRDLLQCPYYMGKVRYKGIAARLNGSSYRGTMGRLSVGLHEPLISEDLWQRCQKVRENRRQKVKSRKMTRHIYLLNGIILCADCCRRLRSQTPKGRPGYYREVSHLNGFNDCPNSRTSVRSTIIDDQISQLVQSLKLPADWEQAVRKMLQETQTGPDLELERKEIREKIRRMRTGYERGVYKDEEHLYWREIETLQQRLEKLDVPEKKVIHRAADTLLNLSESWVLATKEEQRELVQMMLQEVGCSISDQQVVWVKPRFGFEILFQLASDLTPEENGRFKLLKGKRNP